MGIRKHRFLSFNLIFFLFVCTAVWGADEAGIEFFEKRIRPVLLGECYQCHSKKNKVKGGLQLDTKIGWQRGGDSGAALVPGKPQKSLLIQAIRQTNEALKMPPKKKLSSEQISDFEDWVAMGAPDPRTAETIDGVDRELDILASRQFWAFQPLSNRIEPLVSGNNWGYSSIDQLVINALQSKGIAPIKDADNLTLLRRVYFDLIGLPPSPSQIAEFENAVAIDKSEAFKKVVDELLSKPQFGERWGRHWLDVARFCESTSRGILMDEAWRYRDYVIKSYNDDKAYDEFIREQVAGDLIDGGNLTQRRERLIATAFLLLGPTLYELQDKTILEMNMVDEQMDTMGKTFLGLTVGCARCHDHKFDPITTGDYYGLAGILKGTKMVVHSNVSKWNTRPLPMGPDLEVLARKQALRIAQLKKEVNGINKQLGKATGKLEPINQSVLPGIVVDNPDAELKGIWAHSSGVRNFVGIDYIYATKGDGNNTARFAVKFEKAGQYEVHISYTHHPNRSSNTFVKILHKDGVATRRINQQKQPSLDGYFISLGTYAFPEGVHDALEISNEGANGTIVADAVQFISSDSLVLTKARLPTKGALKNDSNLNSELNRLTEELKRLEKKAVKIPSVIAVGEGEKNGAIHIAIRGNVHSKGPKTPRSFIKVLHSGAPPKFPEKGSGRLQLADWIASKDNPLTARVYANRVWYHLFGRGIVSTTDNFGHTGQAPSNQSLLDHLAISFIEDGWSTKKLIQRIVLSRVYQLGSTPVSGVQDEVDLENKLFWRQNRRRLEAEPIRDSMMMIANQLDFRMGGMTIKSGAKIDINYQYAGAQRSVYVPVIRTKQNSFLEAFDFPDPNLVAGKRSSTSVPSQSLFFMNSSLSRTLAQHASSIYFNPKKRTDESQLRLIYKSVLGRNPTLKEQNVVLAFLKASVDQKKAHAQLFQGLFSSPDFRCID
ncbi:DUF1553 domain-containing protein [bacterium]|nr:DUF1553 domain-containing protein [bacterium]